MLDFAGLLDALAECEGKRLEVSVRGRDTGSAPVVVLRGVAGQLQMSKGWAADDEVGSIAYVPLGAGPDGKETGGPGLYFNPEVFTTAAGDDRVLHVTLEDVDLQLVVEPN